MGNSIESLEGRTLFSAASALAAEVTLYADADALRTQLRDYVTTYKADAAAIKADVKALPKTKANRGLIAAVVKNQAKVLGMFAAGETKLARAAGPAIKRAIAAGAAVAANPKNTAALAKLQAAVAIAEAKGVAPLADVVTTLEGASTTLFASLSALSAANPTATPLSDDIVTAQAHVTDARTTLTAAFTQVEADAATLSAALS